MSWRLLRQYYYQSKTKGGKTANKQSKIKQTQKHEQEEIQKKYSKNTEAYTNAIKQNTWVAHALDENKYLKRLLFCLLVLLSIFNMRLDKTLLDNLFLKKSCF